MTEASPRTEHGPGRVRIWRRDRRGFAAVEFALVSMVMMIWIFGMMELARAFWTYQILQQVAIEGSRCMGVLSTNCAADGTYNSDNAKSYMVTLASGLGMTLPAADIAVTRPTNCAGISGFSKVSINYTFQTQLPVVLPGLSSVTLTANSCYYNTQ